mgnify:FL=1
MREKGKRLPREGPTATRPASLAKEPGKKDYGIQKFLTAFPPSPCQTAGRGSSGTAGTNGTPAKAQ